METFAFIVSAAASVNMLLIFSIILASGGVVLVEDNRLVLLAEFSILCLAIPWLASAYVRHAENFR